MRIGISNPFGNSVRKYCTEAINIGYTGYSKNYNYNNANNIRVSVSYRFGSLNVQVKKAKASIKNDDVENRRNYPVRLMIFFRI